jgi:hypothetical protein
LAKACSIEEKLPTFASRLNETEANFETLEKIIQNYFSIVLDFKKYFFYLCIRFWNEGDERGKKEGLTTVGF